MSSQATARKSETHVTGHFILPPLPYGYGDLEPTLSDLTLRTHHGKHHAKYVKKTNELVEKSDLSSACLEDVVCAAEKQDDPSLFNAAAQAWNHAFFWESMTPGQSAPKGELARAIENDFGSLDALKSRMVAEGKGHFASGWLWLVAINGRLDVVSTHDADNLLSDGDLTPLLTCDLWEHAYYLDYKQKRGDWLAKWFDNLANWEFAAAQYDAAKGQGAPWRYPEAQ